MSGCLIGFPNRVDTSVLSGGSWLSSLPLSFMQNRILGKVARSTNLSLSSTQFNVDLGSSKVIRVISLVNHNLSLDASVRIRLSDDPSFATSIIDTGFVDAYSVVYTTETLDFESTNWWDCRYTAEEIVGYTANFISILDSNTYARYILVEISDPSNTAGYVQIGRAFFGPAWQPTHTAEVGLNIGIETNTSVMTALSGAKYFQRKIPYRVTKFSLDVMSEDEALANAFEIDRRAGIDQEVLWIQEENDTIHALRRRWLGTLSSLNSIEFPFQHLGRKAYEIQELI